MEAPLYVTTFAFVINRTSTTRCPTSRRRRSTTTATPRTAGKVGEFWGKMEDAGIDKDQGGASHEVYKLTPSRSGFGTKAAEPLVKTWARVSRRTAAIRTRRWPSLRLRHQVQRARAVDA